jgi:hypothetical protein
MGRPDNLIENFLPSLQSKTRQEAALLEQLPPGENDHGDAKPEAEHPNRNSPELVWIGPEHGDRIHTLRVVAITRLIASASKTSTDRDNRVSVGFE